MIAVDTNVLIYACDQADPRRQKVALDLITNAQDGVLLWQVACEFLSASRKLEQAGIHLDPRLESSRRVPGSAAARPADRWQSGVAPRSSISHAERRCGTPSFSRRASKPASRPSTLRTCPDSTISRASASSTPSSSDRQRGRGGGRSSGRGWPPSPSAALPRLVQLRGDSPASRRAATPWTGPMLPPSAVERTGGGLCRPVSAPAQVSQQGWGVSDPACALAIAAPGPSSGVAHAPRVSVDDVLGARCRGGECSPRFRANLTRTNP